MDMPNRLQLILPMKENTHLHHKGMFHCTSNLLLFSYNGVALLQNFSNRFTCFDESNLVKQEVCLKVSVTRLGDLLDFGQFFKAFGNN